VQDGLTETDIDLTRSHKDRAQARTQAYLARSRDRHPTRLGTDLPITLFRDLVDSVSDFIGTVDEDGNLLYINPAGRRLLEIPADEDIRGKSLFAYNERSTAQIKSQATSGADTWTGNSVLTSRSGRRIPVSQMLVSHQTSGRTYVSTIAREITDQLAAEAELRHRADHDPLTNLLNRSAFRHLVEHRADKTMLLVLLDLDRFKAVNDTYGHHAGDEILQGTARVLEGAIEGIGYVARLGGDEFALVLFDHNIASAATTLAHLLAQLRAYLTPFDVGASVGLAELDEHTPLDAGMRSADVALYAYKGTGRPDRRTGPRAQRSRSTDVNTNSHPL
jgi:diguanylate cyclase (GGDEF)-like protein/PAS domain S-box-containing protein